MHFRVDRIEIYSFLKYQGPFWIRALQWLHNEHDSVSNHLRIDCLFNSLSVQEQIKENTKLCVTGFCGRNPPVTGGFPSQRASNVENVSIWWQLNYARKHINHIGRFIIQEWQKMHVYLCLTKWNRHTLKLELYSNNRFILIIEIAKLNIFPLRISNYLFVS